jgi:hypothetical protein
MHGRVNSPSIVESHEVMKKKAQPRDKVTLERDPVSHKPVVMLRLTVFEARVLQFVARHVGGIGKSRNIISMIGNEISSALWRDREYAPMPTTLTPPARFSGLNLDGRYSELYIYDVEPLRGNVKTDPRAPEQLDTRKRDIVLE